MLKKADFLGKIVKWGASLGAFDIQYRPRTSIKGQVLADFIVKFTLRHLKVLHIGKNKQGSPKKSPIWQVYVDGALNC